MVEAHRLEAGEGADRRTHHHVAGPVLVIVDPRQAVPLLKGVDGVPDRRDRNDDPEVQDHGDRNQRDRDRRAPGEQLAPQRELRLVAVDQGQGQRLVQERQSSERIKQLACEEGMRTLRDSALRAVKEGKTTVAEILRATQEDF